MSCCKCCLYMCCPCLLCCMPSSNKEKENLTKKQVTPAPNKATSDEKIEHSLVLSSDENSLKDYEDLEHIAQVRQIRVTIQKGTRAGIAAGLTVTAGELL